MYLALDEGHTNLTSLLAVLAVLYAGDAVFAVDESRASLDLVDCLASHLIHALPMEVLLARSQTFVLSTGLLAHAAQLRSGDDDGILGLPRLVFLLHLETASALSLLFLVPLHSVARHVLLLFPTPAFSRSLCLLGGAIGGRVGCGVGQGSGVGDRGVGERGGQGVGGVGASCDVLQLLLLRPAESVRIQSKGLV